jgi:hypothetical protein
VPAIIITFFGSLRWLADGWKENILQDQGLDGGCIFGKETRDRRRISETIDNFPKNEFINDETFVSDSLKTGF